MLGVGDKIRLFNAREIAGEKSWWLRILNPPSVLVPKGLAEPFHTPWGHSPDLSELYLSSVQFSRSVMSDSLRPLNNKQHARPPCPLPTPRVHSDSRPSSQWCHPAISSSVVPFSSCPQSFTASGSFQWVSSLHQVAKVLEFQLQHQSLQWTPMTDLL